MPTRTTTSATEAIGAAISAEAPPRPPWRMAYAESVCHRNDPRAASMIVDSEFSGLTNKRASTLLTVAYRGHQFACVGPATGLLSE